MEPRYCPRCRAVVHSNDPQKHPDKCPSCRHRYDGLDDPFKQALLRVDKATELLSIAVKMREAQKEYFKTRRGDVLADSKRLEREFDKAVDAYFNPPTPDLFDAH